MVNVDEYIPLSDNTKDGGTEETATASIPIKDMANTKQILKIKTPTEVETSKDFDFVVKTLTELTA